jgi:hypothetical protein
MFDQEMNWPLANRANGFDRMARPADMGQSIAAIIAMTKSEWILHERAVLRPPHPKTDGRRRRAAPENAP